MTAAVERPPVRLGVVGYCTGGRHFHAPFVQAADGIELAGSGGRSRSRRHRPLDVARASAQSHSTVELSGDLGTVG